MYSLLSLAKHCQQQQEHQQPPRNAVAPDSNKSGRGGSEIKSEDSAASSISDVSFLLNQLAAANNGKMVHFMHNLHISNNIFKNLF